MCLYKDTNDVFGYFVWEVYSNLQTFRYIIVRTSQRYMCQVCMKATTAMYASNLTYRLAVFSFSYSLVVYVVVGVYIQGHKCAAKYSEYYTPPSLNFSPHVYVVACLH